MPIFSSRKGPRELAIPDTIKQADVAQKSPIGEFPAKKPVKPRQSLAEAWQDADVRFRQATRNRRSLRDAGPQSMDTYLEQWAAKCEVDDSDDARKKNQMICVLRNILDGIDIVGGIVAGGASLAFPPAGACFGAISFLIDIPRQVEKVYDTLLVLFAEVEEFLVRFKILKRIDDKRRLDIAMIEEASRMLVSFVDVCILSIKLLEEHKVSTVFKAALLKNDSGIGAALEGFRRLAKSLDSLTSTVVFEHILVVEETVKEVSIGFKSIVASHQETRTERINAERLRNIEAKIFDNKERSLWEDFAQTIRPSRFDSALPNTCDVLESHSQYQKWLDSAADHATLFLVGGEGTGKSYMLESLRERLETLRSSSNSEEEKMYVAFHAFNTQRTKATGSKGQDDSRIPFALRSMALQVAAQSLPYAKELEGALRDNRNLKNIDQCKSLWQALRLSTFKAPAGATMYLLLDGLDQEIDVAAIPELYKVLTSGGSERDEKQPRIRTVFTCDVDKTKTVSGLSFSRIDMGDLTETLMPEFVSNEMKRLDIFQGFDKKSKTQHQKIVQGLNEENDDNFKNTTKKLERVQIAIQDDLPSSKLDDIIRNKDSEVGTKQAKQILDTIASTMKPVYISQANQIIAWLLYSQCGYALNIDELEAMLLLQQDHNTLNSLEKKLDLHFKDLFEKDNGCLYLKDGLEDALQESESLLIDSSEPHKPTITMNISITNSDDTMVRSFLSDLSAQMNERGLDFRTGNNSTVNTIYANRLQGHLNITSLCFKLLNDGWGQKQETEALLWYALDYLPRNLVELAKMRKKNPSCFSPDDLRMIGQGLVSFLSDPYDIMTADDTGFGSGTRWVVDDSCVMAIKVWLRKTKNVLQMREQRWIDAALTSGCGKLHFMKDFARAVGRKWVTHPRCPSYSLYVWLDQFLDTAGYSPDQASHSDFIALELPGDTSAVGEIAKEDDPTQDTIETSSDDEIDLGSVRLQPQQRVQRVIDWVQREVTNVRRDGVFNANIADTYKGIGDTSLAVKHYEKARTDPATYRRALVGLGRIKKEARATKEEAVELLLEVIDSMEKDWQEEELEKRETDLYFELLEEAGSLLDELGRTSDAVSLFKRSLKVKDNVEMMFITLRLMAKVKQESDAIELLEQRSEDSERQPLSACILQCAEQRQTFDKFVELIKAIRGRELRTMITVAVQEAVNAAERKIRSDAKSKLLHLHAIIIATGYDEDRRQIATHLWHEVLSMLHSSMPFRPWNHETVYDAATGATGYRFDQARAKYLANPKMTVTQQDEIYEGLYEYTTDIIVGLRLNCAGRVQHPECYAHAMGIVLGRTDAARSAISEDMRLALDILTDEDKTNDVVGILLLIRIFHFFGDKAGALSAFSLLDRERLAIANKDSMGTTIESGPTLKYDDSSWRECYACRKYMLSEHADGYWSCRFCPIFYLCTQCYNDFMSEEMRLPMCNPNHEYLHLYHTHYEPEEIETDKVRIDWEYVQLDDGKFERKGGRIVTLSEWVSELRKSWNISGSESSSDSDSYSDSE